MTENNVKNSLSADYFDEVYRANDDPWNFETSEYESAKYAETLKVLPHEIYESAFEIGCSIGVLTAKLAERCRNLLAIDVSEKALDTAKKRCLNFSNVDFRLMQIPHEFPVEKFDLIIVSEVGYYLSVDDWKIASKKLISMLKPHGNIVLVHWTHFVSDYPQTGDNVHDLFAEWNRQLKHIDAEKYADYRLDVWENV